MDLEEGTNDLNRALLCKDEENNSNQNQTENEVCANPNEEEPSNVDVFWGEDAASDDDDDDSASSSSNNTTNSENQSTGQEILAIAIPALAGLAIDPLMTLADTAFVGRTAPDATSLAGMGSSAALLTFSFYLFNFLCTVTTPLVSHRRASGDDAGAVEVGGQALSLALLLGILLAFVLTIFSGPLLGIMGTGQTGEEAHRYANSFLHIRAVAAPAVFVVSASTGILRGYLDTRTTFAILLGSNIVNLSLDVIFIGWLRMGPTGAAIATTTAEWICALSLLMILAGKIPSVDGKLGSNQQTQTTVAETNREPEGGEESTTEEEGNAEEQPALDPIVTITPTKKIPEWKAMQPLVVASSSVFVRSFMLQLSIAGAAAMATRSGDGSASASANSIAAHQIALQLWLLCSFVCDALAAASQALVADRLGRNDSDGVRDVSKTIFVYAFVLGLVLAGALGLGDYTGFLLKLFTTDAPTQEALKPLLVLLIVAQPLNSFVFAADGVLQGASVFAYQAKTMVLSVLVAFASFFCLGSFLGGAESESTLVFVWYSLLVLQLMRGITSLWKLLESNGPIDLFHRRSTTRQHQQQPQEHQQLLL